MRQIPWVRGRVRQIPSACGVRGKTGYTAREDLKSINSYNMGERRMRRVWLFRSCAPRPCLVLPALLSLSHPNCLHHQVEKRLLVVSGYWVFQHHSEVPKPCHYLHKQFLQQMIFKLSTLSCQNSSWYIKIRSVIFILQVIGKPM